MKIFDVQIDEITLADAIQRLDQPQLIFTPNPEILLQARQSKNLRDALSSGTLFLPDGHGLLFVSSLLKFKSKIIRLLWLLPSLFLFLIWKRPFTKILPAVIHGADFMDHLIHWAAKNNKSVYFLGARNEVPGKCANYFAKKYSKLKVAGFSNLDPSEASFKEVLAARPDVLLVAYGAPKQEEWILKYRKKIPSLFHVMAVGGSFDFWSGSVKRAPRIIRRIGLEWLWRLILQPKIRLRRIWNAVVKFPIISLFFS